MKKKGYTVAEFVFALILFTIFLLLNIGMYTNSLKNVKKAERLSQAINLAIGKTEEIQKKDYDQVDSEEYEPFENNSNYTVIVAVDEDSDSITTAQGNPYKVFKNVLVTVKYVIGGEEESISLKSVKINDNLVNEIYSKSTI